VARRRRGDTDLSTGQVARVFRVDVRTVQRWADDGRIAYTKTEGGHRRYKVADVQALVEEMEQQGEGTK